MATILYVGTHGSDEATRASLPFHAAVGAIEAGHQPQIVLVGDATYLAKPSVASEIRGVAVPPLTELQQKLVDHGAPIYV
jgi:predicted peroxiredoxin